MTMLYGIHSGRHRILDSFRGGRVCRYFEALFVRLFQDKANLIYSERRVLSA